MRESIFIWLLVCVVLGISYSQTTISKSVISSGGGEAKGQEKVLALSVGQPVVGLINTDSSSAQIGFWMVTSIEGELESEAVIRQLSEPWIGQNYPNPFRARTNFELILSKKEHVKIFIYSNDGKLIDTFINREMKSGRYELSWQADLLPEGVYYYELVIGDFRMTRSMISTK